MTGQGSLILEKKGHAHSGVYRGILELLARFGYVSVREVMYGWDLDLFTASNRLKYLKKAGLIKDFPSTILPSHFYCLTSKGREAIRHFVISEELLDFVPSSFQLIFHKHHFSILKVYLVLQKVFGGRFLGWASERTLRAEEEARQKLTGGKEKRILDGELFLDIEKTRFRADGNGDLEKTGEPSHEQWRCGVEVELSLKSPERYSKQFKDLASRVYNSVDEHQHYRMILFFYGTTMIHDRLAGHLRSGRYNFGECVFGLCQIDDLLEHRETASVERFVGSSSIQVPLSEMSRVKVVVK